MQESAPRGHFFWDFSGRKWGFSDCPAAGTGELLPECGLWKDAAFVVQFQGLGPYHQRGIYTPRRK